ncbi:MAG: DUF429 domain-containing protein [Actinomycetota bacterium]
MRFVGVDLAAQPEKSSMCLLDWARRPKVVDIVRPATDDAIVTAALDAMGVGIDVPFGWPTPFVDKIRRWHDGQSAALDDTTPRDLRLRTTDQWIRTHVPRDPLSVSTDRLGIVALRGIGILEKLLGPRGDRSGRRGIYEAYPGGTLAVWGLPATGYKGKDGAAKRSTIVDALETQIDFGDFDVAARASDDDLDAILTAVIAGLARAKATTKPPAEHRRVAAIEGWIHVPTIGLADLTEIRF